MTYYTEDILKKVAPSIFTMQPHDKTSEKYAHIPTIEYVRGLEKAGFYPVKILETKCRDSANIPYGKHLIRFRRKESVEVGGNLAEIVMINSHNGLSSFQMKAGIYRLACSNGLIVGNDMFCQNIRHQGDVISKVVESANQIIDVIPQVLETSREWAGIPLNQEQKYIFAESAASLKWIKEDGFAEPERLLLVRRNHDFKNDLWTVYNVIQENMMRGGVSYYNKKTKSRNKTREVKSVNENSRLNTALWNLTEKMALLAKAA